MGALARCQELREGRTNEAQAEGLLCDDLWPLERAQQALRSPPEELAQPLSRVAQSIDRERTRLAEQFAESIDDIKKTEKDIKGRQPKKKPYWEGVLDALAVLREAYSHIKIPILGPKHYNDAKGDFTAACEKYEGICPEDPEFLKLLDDEPGVYLRRSKTQ